VISRKAFSNYYHFTTVGLGRLVALMPRLIADPTIAVLMPNPDAVNHSIAYIEDSLSLLGIQRERILRYPACRLVFAEEVLIAGIGPRMAFGPNMQKNGHQAVMIDNADRGPALAVRAAFLRVITSTHPASHTPARALLIDRPERRRIANIDEVITAIAETALFVDGPVYCEKLSLAEQISRFHNAAVVTAVTGACLSNLLYMRRTGLVVDIVPARNYIGDGTTLSLDCGITYFWALASNIGLRYVPIMLADADLSADSLHVPAERLKQVIQQNWNAATLS